MARQPRAVAPLRHGLILNPNDPQNVAWHILLAYAELLSDAPDKALESANRALALRPGFGPTFEVLCCCAIALGQVGDARRWAARIGQANSSEGQFVEPLKANNPNYAARIATLLAEANASAHSR